MADRLKTKTTVSDFCNGVGAWSLIDQFDVTELLKAQEAKIAKLEGQVKSYIKLINTNTERHMTMEDRFFTADEEGFITDNNFDFDAALHVSGDFVDNEKALYAQMIVTALNSVVEYDKMVARYEDIIEEQKRTIIALNDCIGGEGSCTTDNLVRVGRLEHTIQFLTKRNEILAMALQEAIDGMGGSYAIWAPKAKSVIDMKDEYGFE